MDSSRFAFFRFGPYVINFDAVAYIGGEEDRVVVHFVGGGTLSLTGLVGEALHQWLTLHYPDDQVERFGLTQRKQ